MDDTVRRRPVFRILIAMASFLTAATLGYAQVIVGQSDDDYSYKKPVQTLPHPVPPAEKKIEDAPLESYESIYAKPRMANPSILAVNRSFSVAFQFTSFYYTEPSDSVSLYSLFYPIGSSAGYFDDEQGTLQGGKIAASWMTKDNNWYVHAEWSGVEGQVQYTGFYQNGRPANGLQSRATIQDYDLKGGKGFTIGETAMVTPYWVFGGHHWLRELGLGTPGDYNESYSHNYLGLGTLFQYAPWSDFVVTTDASVSKMMGPKINVPGTPLSNTPLGASPIITLGIEGDYCLKSFLHLFAGFDYMYYTYGQSGLQFGGGLVAMEPFSKTELYNFDLGVRISFDQILKSESKFFEWFTQSAKS
jgi:hypothetical protein